MRSNANLYLFRSKNSPEYSCYCRDSQGGQLPEKFAPWIAVGVLRPDQNPPHGLSRQAIETGIEASGFQLFRSKQRVRSAS